MRAKTIRCKRVQFFDEELPNLSWISRRRNRAMQFCQGIVDEHSEPKKKLVDILVK